MKASFRILFGGIYQLLLKKFYRHVACKYLRAYLGDLKLDMVVFLVLKSLLSEIEYELR